MNKFETPPVVFVLEEQIEKLKKQNAEKDKTIEKLEQKIKYRDSYIINFIDNWNYLRDLFSWVKGERIENEFLCYTDVFEECTPEEFIDGRKFSEDFAMNTFSEWLELEKKDYSIDSLGGHEKFKNYFWENQKDLETKEKE